jgi:trehalose utilization protein
VLVWNEFRLERLDTRVAAHYPDGIHALLGRVLRAKGCEVREATLDRPEQGLDVASLDWADALVWWGHAAHDEVSEEAVTRVVERVRAGLGMVALHSAHFSRPFKRLLGTPCTLSWREALDRERIWVVEPSHPIAQGLPPSFDLEHEEMYGEPFAVPPPDELVLISHFSGGEVFRSGCGWKRERGRLFYFRPGHETWPSYHHPLVQRVIVNAVRWVARSA